LHAFEYYTYNIVTVLLILLETHFTLPETVLKTAFKVMFIKLDPVSLNINIWCT